MLGCAFMVPIVSMFLFGLIEMTFPGSLNNTQDDKVSIRIPRKASFNLKNVMKEVSKFEDKFEIELKFRNPYLTAYGWKKVEYPQELNKNEKKIV